MKNTIYMDEVKVAFADISKLKKDMDVLFDQFNNNCDKLNKAEQEVLTTFQKRYKRDLINFKDIRSIRFVALKNGYKSILATAEVIDWDDLGPGWQSTVEMDAVEEGQQKTIRSRKHFIVSCAKFKIAIEKFQSEFLEAMSAAQVKKEEIEAPKVQKKQVKSQSVTSDTMFERLKKMAQRVYATVKNTVNNVIRTVKTSIEDMVVCMKRTVAAIIA